MQKIRRRRILQLRFAARECALAVYSAKTFCTDRHGKRRSPPGIAFDHMSFMYLVLENSPYGKYVFVVGRRGVLDAGSRGAGVNDGVVAHVDAHMAAVADDITRLRL